MALAEPDHLKWLLDSRQPVVVVDLRPAGEFRRGHLPGAVSVPLAELERRAEEIPTQPMVVLYCRCPLDDGWLRRRFPVTQSPPRGPSVR